MKEIEPMKEFRVGNFKVIPFDNVHDCTCLGYYITHEEMGKFLFVTDTEYVKKNFRNVGLNHILCECNYSQSMVDENYERGIRNRVLQTHMELQTCKEFLRVNNSTSIRNVVICHLSSSNSDRNEFRDEISKVVDCDVEIAKKGLIVDLDLNPF